MGLFFQWPIFPGDNNLIAVRHLRSLFPWRWWMCFRFIAMGVRIHPSALLNGDRSNFKLGKGTKIGASCRFEVKRAGMIGCGERVWMSSDVEMETNTSIYVSEGTTIQRRCTINGSVRIGAGCIFAPNVFISSGTHPFKDIPHLPIRVQEQKIISLRGGLTHLDRPIWIQDDCWLGINAVVCPGVTIGKGSVIGANAVVTQDVAPYSIMAGVPAKVIGRRLDWLPPRHLSADCEEDAPYILSGLRRAAYNGVPAGIQVTNDVPFCAVLPAEHSNTMMRYQFYTTHDVEVMVSGDVLNISAGEEVLDICIERKLDKLESIFCEIKIITNNYGGTLLVCRLDVLN